MAIKFTENVATDLRFPYGDYREVEGNFGPQFMYTVEDGTGHTDRLFASPDLHRALQRVGVGPGSEVRVTATRGERRRRIWDVSPAVPGRDTVRDADDTENNTASRRSAEPRPELRIESPRRPPATGNGHQAPHEGSDRQSDADVDAILDAANGDRRPPLPTELEQMGQLMGLCLHASTRAWRHVVHGRQSPGDVRAVAITLFLECSRRGVSAEEMLQDLAA